MKRWVKKLTFDDDDDSMVDSSVEDSEAETTYSKLVCSECDKKLLASEQNKWSCEGCNKTHCKECLDFDAQLQHVRSCAKFSKGAAARKRVPLVGD